MTKFQKLLTIVIVNFFMIKGFISTAFSRINLWIYKSNVDIVNCNFTA